MQGIHSCREDQFNRGPDPDNAREFHDETIPSVSGKVAQQDVDEQAALAKGMEQKAGEFVKQGGQLYRKA